MIINNKKNITHKINYIQIDSAQRSKYPINIYDELYNLSSFPLEFINGSSVVTVHFPNHPYQIDDQIVLNNVVSKNAILNNVLAIKKNSFFVRIYHQNHGLSLYGLYDWSDPNDFIKIEYVDNLPLVYKETDDIPDTINQYYILKKNADIDLKIQLSNIKGSDPTKNFIGNIPTNYLNGKHVVYLLFYKNGQFYYHDPNSYLVMLEKKSLINYKDDNIFGNNIYVKFYNLFGIPLNHLNSGTPINENTKYPYLAVTSTNKNSFTIDTMYPAIVDPNINFYSLTDVTNLDLHNDDIRTNRGGGGQVLIRKILKTRPGYPNPSNYVHVLDRTYNNVISAKIIGSIFPNSQRTINNDASDIINNKLYWRNLDDGDHIYQLSIDPGNYSPQQLIDTIENKFNNTLRLKYTNNNFDNTIYDENGYNKYHIISMEISDITDKVTLSTFKELVQVNDPMNRKILSIPDNLLEITTNSSPIKSDEFLFIYFTHNSHPGIDMLFPYAYNNLYITDNIPNTQLIDVPFTFQAKLNTDIAVLVNFYKIIDQDLYGTINEIKSINTSTILNDFNYDYSTSIVTKSNHNLKVGDLILTDQFIDANTNSKISIYEISSIIDSNHFLVKKYDGGIRYKFLYDDIAINFGAIDNVLTFSSILPKTGTNNILRVYHKNHQLMPGDKITITNSRTINQVPSDVINTTHTINKILDDNNYEILLNIYIPTGTYDESSEPYLVAIKYPDLFQLLFNYPDTLGNYLSFKKVGDDIAITPFRHTISNTDPYINDYNFDSLGSEYQFHLKKLDMTGSNYFYICCPQLVTIANTKPISNVFSIIRWFDDPGSVVFDSFVPTTKYFQTPISSISELEFTMVQPDGRLVQFNGVDHSFTIELVESFNQLANNLE
jgi:hypothetical protein